MNICLYSFLGTFLSFRWGLQLEIELKETNCKHFQQSDEGSHYIVIPKHALFYFWLGHMSYTVKLYWPWLGTLHVTLLWNKIRFQEKNP